MFEARYFIAYHQPYARHFYEVSLSYRGLYNAIPVNSNFPFCPYELEKHM